MSRWQRSNQPAIPHRGGGSRWHPGTGATHGSRSSPHYSCSPSPTAPRPKPQTPPHHTVTLGCSHHHLTNNTTITLTATATDDHAVARVEFYRTDIPTTPINNQQLTKIGEDDTPPYELQLAVTTADNGTITFTATATDTTGNTATSEPATLTVDIPTPNETPRFDSSPVTGAVVGEPYSYLIATSDPNGDDLAITAPTLPSWLILTDHHDNTATLEGTPGPGEVGDHQIELVVTDSLGATGTQAFTLTVSATNTPPEFTSTPVTDGEQDTPYSYTITAEDPDPGDVLTITAPVLPGWLALGDHHDGSATLEGTPTQDEVGNHAVELRVTDSVGAADTQAFNITVHNINDPPTANHDEFITEEDTPVGGNVLDDNGAGPDHDPDTGDTLAVTDHTQPAHGSLTLNPDGTFTYTPHPHYHGSDGFEYEIQDGHGATDSATVFITITPVNDPPTFDTTQATRPSSATSAPPTTSPSPSTSAIPTATPSPSPPAAAIKRSSPTHNSTPAAAPAVAP